MKKPHIPAIREVLRAHPEGLTAKLGIDATRSFGEGGAEKLVMSAEPMAWARELVDRIARA